MFRLLWVDESPAPSTVSHCPEVSSDPGSPSCPGTNGGGPLFHQTKGREAALPGGPGVCPSKLRGAERPAEPLARRSASRSAAVPRQNRPDPSRVRRPFRTPIRGEGPRSAAWRPKTRRAVGKPGEGRLSREAQAVPWATPKPSTRGRAGEFPRSGISLPEGGGLEGESPKGESPGEFPAELGGRRKFPGTREWPTDRPRRHGSPEGGSDFKPRQAKLAGWGLWWRVWRLVAAGIRRTKRESPGRASPGILAPGA